MEEGEEKNNVGEKGDGVIEKEEMAKRGEQNITLNIAPAASSSKKRCQEVKDKLFNFYYEGKIKSPATFQPGSHCEQLLLLENNGRSVVGAPKVNPSLGKDFLESTKTKKKFLETTQYNPSTCSKKCPKLLTDTKETNSDQKKCVTEGNSRKSSPVGLDKGASLRMGQELSKGLGFIENTEENVSSNMYSSSAQFAAPWYREQPIFSGCELDTRFSTGDTTHLGIYSSQQPAIKKKPDQPRAVEKKMPKKCSLKKLPWFSKGRSFHRKGKETSHFVRERHEELKQWTKFLNSGFTSRAEEDLEVKEEVEEQDKDLKEEKGKGGERGEEDGGG